MPIYLEALFIFRRQLILLNDLIIADLVFINVKSDNDYFIFPKRKHESEGNKCTCFCFDQSSLRLLIFCVEK